MKNNEMTTTAVQAALDAGEAILTIYARDFDVEIKSDNSPLTEADKASHEIIVSALETTPYPVLSEESAKITYDERKDWETYWLVDPLDGTKEFIKRNGEFTVNIALIENGRPVFGVVFAPVLDVLYWGQLAEGMEQGAWRCTACAGRTVEDIRSMATPCAVRHAPSGSTLRVVASRSHRNEETEDFIAELEEKYGPAECVSQGSSLKLCMVADGTADIYPRIAPTMEWDTAAAHAVVAAAGGAVFEYDPAIPAESYSLQSAESRVQRESNSMPHAPCPLHYNKQNLLNPYFVVSGLSKKW